MKTFFALGLALLGIVAAGEKQIPIYEAMDYGPFLSMTLNLGKETNGRDGAVVKATVVKLGDKEHPVCVAYDTELMRVAAAWTGGFIDFNGTIFNGNHHAQPKPKGDILLKTKAVPGWAVDGKFDDPRPEKRGPMPQDIMKFGGIYRNGNEVVLKYSVAGCEILEKPSLLWRGKIAEIKREFNVAPSEKNLAVLVGETDETNTDPPFVSPTSFRFAYGKHKLNGDILTESKLVASSLDHGQVIYNVRPHDKAILFTITMFVDSDGWSENGLDAEPQVLSELTRGGPALWPETVTTQGKLGKDDGPYTVDTLTIPFQNPYHSWMRLGGFDFFADGKRAAVCTWSGDVWIVCDIDDKLEKLTWKRFAAGLYQPLGLKIVDEKIYVTCRDRIVKLHDLNGDGEADFYESFNDQFILSYHFHEFMMDLQTDAEGNFYFAKGGTPGVGGPNFDIVTPHNGCFFKLSKDGSKLDIVARGLRAPNGIGVGPHGELTSGDNEGSWVPVCPINEIRPHGFVGVVPEGWPGEPPPTYRDPPICWIPWNVDNSAGAQVWVTSKKWGPFEGEMFHLSYGKSSLFHVLTERIDTQIQGGVAKLPLTFDSGIMRARFNPVDGQLYLCGLRGWQTNAGKDGAFQRVRYTGKPVNLPAELHVTATGLKVTFTTPLDKESATDIGNYALWWFNVKWAKEYGSERWSPTQPGKKWSKQATDPPGEEITIQSVALSEDKRTITLVIPGVKPVTNMILRLKIKAADGSQILQEICNTIHRLPLQ